MNQSLDSRALKKSESDELNPTLRAVIDAMPVVIFYRAVRQAFFGGGKSVSGTVEVRG